MREIKFRGKEEYSGEWVYGYYCRGGWIDPVNGVETPRHIIHAEYLFDIDPDTLGQYTGLRDKNGKEIYEGDIVECVSWNEYFSKDGQPMEVFRRKMHISFLNGRFVMVEPMPEPMEDNVWDIIYNGDIEVIGNICDNPELLEKE